MKIVRATEAHRSGMLRAAGAHYVQTLWATEAHDLRIFRAVEAHRAKILWTTEAYCAKDSDAAFSNLTEMEYSRW